MDMESEAPNAPTAESSKRARSRSPGPSESINDSAPPAKKIAVDQKAADVSGDVTADAADSVQLASKDDLKAEQEPKVKAESSSGSVRPRHEEDLVGQGRRGYKGQGVGDRRGQFGRDDKRDWHRGDKQSARDQKKESSDAVGGKDSGAVDEDEAGIDENGDKVKRLPKKKVAILLGYCGTGYSGMQIQTHHGAKTIEGDFFDALIKAGAVSPENAVDHRKVDVQRAARTDAGVHAAGNCISMKMIIGSPLPPEHETLESYVNSFLPEQIRMWGYVRTLKSFQARLSCDSRVYEYVLPSYCLLPPRAGEPLTINLDQSSPGWKAGLGVAAEFADAGVDLAPGAEAIEGSTGAEKSGDETKREEREKLDNRSRGEYERRRGWRVDKDTLAKFRALIKEFEGTHNFHNYTVGKPFRDRTVKRFMMNLKVRDPQVVGDIEWISVRIHGQSFMLHQIRKMISMAMLACRTNSPASLIPETFGPKTIHIPKAPPLGLLLEAPQFGSYNSRVKEQKDPQAERDPIDWALYGDKMQEFKLKFIYEKLRQDELESHIFHKWIRQIDCTSSASLSFLNSKGVIPPEAQVQPGRDMPGEKKGSGKTDGGDELNSDDEEKIDPELLKRGELEG
ncbi:pseudouridine synthase [Kockovaella imperatae]|uniref:tRNA pseudouridine synthase 1 n=1 Tax=Kockovaella imperatae TaxID=4999 RepID=A0A1Y1UIX1_9TREE|nr:pseudouridine synthase [Kockovaella imperatae]ORX37055.1 pseudouridine synthase [Kockovaella imperatae]